MNRDLVPRPEPRTLDLLAPDPIADLAITNVQEFITRIANGSLSLRGAQRIVDAAGTACDFADALQRIVRDGAAIARMSATCAYDVAKLRTLMEALKAERAASDLARAEAEARKNAIALVVAEEMDVRTLTARLQKKQLELQLQALEAEAAEKEQPPPPPPAAQAGRFGTRIPDITDATMERLTFDAARIVSEVQAGAVPTGIRQPYHAFAACLYLRARIDGADSRAAAEITRTELVSQMLVPEEFTPNQIRAFVREYKDLKKRFDAQTAETRGASLLQSLTRLGVPPIPHVPRNGNGAA